MANEFVARKGLIVLENGITATGSITSSVGVRAPYFYGSGQFLTDIIPAGTISSSNQFTDPNAPFTGSFSGSFYGDGSNLSGIATLLNIAGTTGTDALNLKTDTLTFNGAEGGITASVTDNTVTLLLPPGAVSSSEQIRTGDFTGSFLGNVIGTSSWATNALTSSIAVTASYAMAAALPPGTVSSSEQINNGAFTGSFLGNVIGTASWAENAITASYALSSALPPGTVSSSEQINNGSFTGSFLGNLIGTSSWAANAVTSSYVLPSGLPSGVVSASSQVDITQTTGYTTFSSSLATVDNNQNIRLNAIEARTGSYATTGSNTFIGNQIISGSLITTADTMNFNGAMTVSGSLTVTGSVISTTGGFTGSLLGTSSWAQNAITASYALASALPPGTVSSSEQINNGAFTGSFLGNVIGTASWAQNAITASYALTSALPPGTVSSSEQINNGAFTGSFLGNLIGTASWAQNVQFSGIVNAPTLVSESSQIIANQITGINAYATTASNTFTGIQNITDTTNSTVFSDGALIVAGGVGIGKDVNISGSVNISGLLTVTSMSTQFVTSSQLLVSDNRIIVNTNDLLRFGGLSVIDSGSASPTTASIYWDSLNHKFIYENLSGSEYNSAMFIAGPRNFGTLGNEVGLTDHRVPVAHGSDHIDSRPESSSIRVDFPSRMTHVEAGLTVTGSVTSSLAKISDVVYTGTTTTNIIGPNTPSGQVVSTLPTANYDGAHFDYLIKDGTNFRTGTVMAVWSGGTVVHTDTSTTDIGNTTQASFDVDLSGGNARLKFLVSSGTWTVKTAIRAF